MSTPFDGPPTLPFDTANHPSKPSVQVSIQEQLAALPRPRKHYRWYSASREANENMWHAPQGVHDLLRALYHFKSADWKGNKPFALKGWTASELAKMPAYYIMDLDKGIAETVAAEMPSKAQIAACKWMTEADLRVYSAEYSRTGFQGGLNSYRIFGNSGDLNSFSGRTIDVPACYLAGASEWGVYQTPGAFEAMQHGACTHLVGVHLIEGAGHSLAEEQPQKVNQLLVEFLQQLRGQTRRG
jgi:pimeloyl-ACP methyl ester carboxylesterase